MVYLKRSEESDLLRQAALFRRMAARVPDRGVAERLTAFAAELEHESKSSTFSKTPAFID
jgi:hypothetical protein